MSVYWEKQLDDIRGQLLMMSALTERNITMAMRALIERDDELADRAVAEDHQIDLLEVHIDQMVVRYMSTHSTMARDGRLMLTASQISNNLERIADQATKIARRSLKLNTEPLLKPLVDIPRMAEVAQGMLRDAMKAFGDECPETAVRVVGQDEKVDAIYKQLVRELTTFMVEDTSTVTRALHLMTIAQAIERIADHATNIAEEVFFLYRGTDIRHDSSLKKPR